MSGNYNGPFGAWYDKTERDPHQYCPAEDGACYFQREYECPAFADEREEEQPVTEGPIGIAALKSGRYR